MEYIDIEFFRSPQESYSRKLDNRVELDERPYGYDSPPPPADTGDFNQRSLESDKQYRTSKGKVHG
jgi:hypothetical protein